MAHELDIAAADFHRTYANLSTALHNCGQLEEAVAVALEGVQWAKKGPWRLQGSFPGECGPCSSSGALGRGPDPPRPARSTHRRGGLAAQSRGRGGEPGRPDRAARGRSRAARPGSQRGREPARRPVHRADPRRAHRAGDRRGTIRRRDRPGRRRDRPDERDRGPGRALPRRAPRARAARAILGLAPIRARRDGATERRLRAAIDARIVAIRDAAAQGGGSPRGWAARSSATPR